MILVLISDDPLESTTGVVMVSHGLGESYVVRVPVDMLVLRLAILLPIYHVRVTNPPRTAPESNET